MLTVDNILLKQAERLLTLGASRPGKGHRWATGGYRGGGGFTWVVFAWGQNVTSLLGKAMYFFSLRAGQSRNRTQPRGPYRHCSGLMS